MDAKTRSLIELLRDETQSRSVFERCNEVLAAANPTGWASAEYVPFPPLPGWLMTEAGWKSFEELRREQREIHATEAEVEIITGERK